MTDKYFLASFLTVCVTQLALRLSTYENLKNRGNSSIAPSQDPFKKLKSLWMKSSKKPEAQKGHLTKRLEFSNDIDHIEVTEDRRAKKSCSFCGKANQGTFPKHLTQQAQYEKCAKTFSVYLQYYQIATRSLSNFQKKCYDTLAFYDLQLRKLLQSPILHADEKGLGLNRKREYIPMTRKNKQTVLACPFDAFNEKLYTPIIGE